MNVDYQAIIDLSNKEMLLAQIITWLKAKGLYNECMTDCGHPNLKQETDKHA